MLEGLRHSNFEIHHTRFAQNTLRKCPKHIAIAHKQAKQALTYLVENGKEAFDKGD